jgi:hypothetical protein
MPTNWGEGVGEGEGGVGGKERGGVPRDKRGT